jgi:hypothetical protein
MVQELAAECKRTGQRYEDKSFEGAAALGKPEVQRRIASWQRPRDFAQQPAVRTADAR